MSTNRMHFVPRPLVVWAAIMIVLGVFFRFYHIDRKIYSNDEATTSLHVSGHTLADYQTIVDGRIHAARDFAVYQHVDPTRGPTDVVRVLAAEDPEHPPVYYLLERQWQTVAGNSIAARRALSALAGVAVIGAAFWCAIELFEAVAPALAFAALVAVSPFHVFYAQNAREYELWAALIMVSTALLARALRLQRTGDWIAYALAGTLALYTDVIFLLVFAGQLLYVAAVTFRDGRRAIVACAASFAFSLVAFSPWLRIMIEDARVHSVTKNAYVTALPLKMVALKYAFIVGQTFMDLDYKYAATAIVLPLVFASIIAAFVVLVRETPERTWLHVVTLTTVTTLALLAWDVVKHNTVSAQARYLVPTWLGIECAVGFAIASLAERESRRSRRIGITTAWVLSLLGIASLAVSSHYREWYGGSGAGVPHEIDIITREHHPLIVFKDDQPAWDEAPLVISNYVDPNDRYEMIPRDGSPLAVTTRPIVLLDSTPQFRSQLSARGFTLAPLYTFEESGALASLRAQGKVVRKEQGYVEYQPSIWDAAPRIAQTGRRDNPSSKTGVDERMPR